MNSRIEDRGLRIDKNRIEDRGLWIEDAGCNVPRAEGLTQSSILDPRSSRGFTLVELLVVVSLVAILASMLFSRVLFYQEMAEKAAMQQVVGALQGALVLQYGHRLTLGMDGELNNISAENPMNWLAQQPINYLGEFNAIKPDAIEPGNWAFERTTHELIYIPDHAEYFEPAKDGVKWIRFRTRFAYEAAPGNKSKRVKELTGVTIAPVEPYQWLIREN
jgi:prepilin-type N-terminal cleavage/methylation domain-containing protein